LTTRYRIGESQVNTLFVTSQGTQKRDDRRQQWQRGKGTGVQSGRQKRKEERVVYDHTKGGERTALMRMGPKPHPPNITAAHQRRPPVPQSQGGSCPKRKMGKQYIDV